MRLTAICLIPLVMWVAVGCQSTTDPSATATKTPATHSDLVNLFSKWRKFEQPPLLDGAPDYRKGTFDLRFSEFKSLQDELLRMDTAGWSIPDQVDWRVVWAEMNGFDFNYRVLNPGSEILLFTNPSGWSAVMYLITKDQRTMA